MNSSSLQFEKRGYGRFIIAILLLGWCVVLILFSSSGASGQVAPVEGLRENKPNVHALVNVKVVAAPGRVLDKATVVLRDGTIESVGIGVVPPADARVWDLEGMTLYPGLIESNSSIGLPKRKPDSGSGKGKEKPGALHWNENVTPQVSASHLFNPDSKTAEKYRKVGFTSALVAPSSGIFKGSSALVNLGDGEANELIVKENVAQHIGFSRKRGVRGYPGSLMGAIALLRQTFFDARWYQKAIAEYAKNPAVGKPDTDEALASLRGLTRGKDLVIADAEDELMVLRVKKLASEFRLNVVVFGSGREYRRLDAIKATEIPIIVPVKFPKAPEVGSSEDALSVDLESLKHWDLAPSNPALLSGAGIDFSLTANGLKKVSDFPGAVRKAIGRGLSEDAALAALTTSPARLFGVSDKLGTIEKGKMANILVVEGKLFDKDATLRSVWINGKHYEVDPKVETDPTGKWAGTISIGDADADSISLEFKGKVKKMSGSAEVSGKKAKLSEISLQGKRLAFAFAGDSLGHKGLIQLSGKVTDNEISGSGSAPGLKSVWWSVARIDSDEDEPKEEKKKESAEEPDKAVAVITYPLGGFGRKKLPEQQRSILVKGGTVWTSGPAGILEDTDILFKNGKVDKIGKNLKAPSNAVVIDAAGKHVTPGLIDAHSHTAMVRGVNEGSQAVSAEVRIEDILTGDRIALYRELAGGLTMSLELHGSANPIGGQSSVIKIRYGALPEDMVYDKAPPTIKFALGENVKQSNWQPSKLRYPRTRMGVDQIIRDEFYAAVDYKARRSAKGGLPFRRDLELDAMVNILDGNLLVHCHSYRQDEILMLIRLAEDFGFRVQTFQHVLEGYKVADEMKKHGASASTFSDWWMYKFEVYDAIPYNGTLMHDVGVVTTFNSDNNQLATRMNLEAAKAVKYGGMSEEEALKLVTINAAIQLKVEKYVGSLEKGKDADFVVWNGHPLSSSTICEQTWLDGRKYFDRDDDLKMRQEIMAEREQLVQKVLASKSKGGKKPGDDKKKDEAGKGKPEYNEGRVER